MISRPNEEAANVRVWVVAAEPWQPDTLFDEPPGGTVLFAALDRRLTRREAEQFVAGFNEQMLPLGGRRWAVARRVEVALVGDLRPGERLGEARFAEGDRFAGGDRFAEGDRFTEGDLGGAGARECWLNREAS